MTYQIGLFSKPTRLFTSTVLMITSLIVGGCSKNAKPDLDAVTPVNASPTPSQPSQTSFQLNLTKGSKVMVPLPQHAASITPSEPKTGVDPKLGLIRRTEGELFYIHGGASLEADFFTLVTHIEETPEPQEIQYFVYFREPVARVKITSPANGSTLKTGTVQVTYQTEGLDFDHLHISLNQAGHNTIRELTGSFELNVETKGSHRIQARLVDSKHRPISLKSAFDEIAIRVE